MYFNQKSILAADYLRLSREDGDKLESDSIRNQRSLINDFVKQHKEIQLVEEYIDDGYSGTNFDRPAFQRMLEDVKRKKINCIIVKDLSRLGRNYIETGRYLEKIFPFMGVRFIAITDHYDSATGSDDADQIIVPFKNLINDAYCRDISIKIRSQLDVKRKNGQFIGNFAAYGYLKDPEDKNHLIVDEYAADIVRLIFNLKIDGYSSQRIAAQLNKMGVLPPLEYKRSRGMNYNSGFRSGSDPKWAVTSINRILQNELYIGTMVQGKNRKINYKVKKSSPIARENWIRVEELYEYIKKARYAAVQLKGMREYAVREQLEGLYTVHDEKYGYILSDDRRELLIDEEAAVVVREIFQMVLDGMPIANIVQILNDSGIESPMVHNARVGHKVWPTYDNKWLFCSVKRILRCTAYAGYWQKTINKKICTLQ